MHGVPNFAFFLIDAVACIRFWLHGFEKSMDVLYDPSFLAAHLLNLRSSLKMNQFWRKWLQKKRQAMVQKASTFGANRRKHCAKMAHFLRAPLIVKTRFLTLYFKAKRSKIGRLLWFIWFLSLNCDHYAFLWRHLGANNAPIGPKLWWNMAHCLALLLPPFAPRLDKY